MTADARTASRAGVDRASSRGLRFSSRIWQTAEVSRLGRRW
ncbi:hypothetical protein [Streptomyces sp. fd1-xmd]|nr:hypothetical protein [Streptomyces sp. fd1-xmd]